MIELILSALLLGAPGGALDDAPAHVAQGKAAITIVRAEPIRALAYDEKDPRARIVEREEDGRTIRLHLIEIE